jgi:hypothetical protein
MSERSESLGYFFPFLVTNFERLDDLHDGRVGDMKDRARA